LGIQGNLGIQGVQGLSGAFAGQGIQGVQGISGALGTGIANGTSNISIPTANGNVVVGVGGIANVATFTNSGINVVGNVTADYFFGNGALLTGIDGATANTGNITFSGTTISDNVLNGNITISPNGTAALNVTSSVSVTGNITSANIDTPGLVTASGNVYGNNIIAGSGTGGNIIGANVITANTFPI
jgi:hypothetical protein